MRPLTDTTPKPLIKVAQKTLLERHIEALVNAGFTDLVINASYRADQLAAFCGDGRQWGCRIHLSMEDTPLETAGGIRKALPLLKEEVFAVVNGDIFTNFPLSHLADMKLRNDLAHLVMVGLIGFNVSNGAYNLTSIYILHLDSRARQNCQNCHQ